MTLYRKPTEAELTADEVVWDDMGMVIVEPDLYHHYCWIHKKPNTTEHKMWRTYYHGKCDVSPAAIIRLDRE